MLKLCANCGKPIPYGQRYCKACAAKLADGNKTRRKNWKRHVDPAIKAFYDSKDWDLAKGGYYHLHGGWCIDCLNEYRLGLRDKKDIGPAVEVHHIVPISLSYEGRLDQNNLIGLCHEHHDIRHGRRKPFFREYDTYQQQMMHEPGGYVEKF
jgi:5-methylcytosine-specific restriction endonuclease McrA